MTPIVPEFSRLVRVDHIPAAGLSLDLSAKPAELAALADRFGLQSISRLDAQVVLKPLAGGAVIRLDGRFSAEVVQTCVVTLEPVPARLDEEFSLTFGVAEPEVPGEEIELSLDEEDPPDPIIDGHIDAGEAVAEHVALALDPFPRKPGIAFEGGPVEPVEEEKRPSPFAVLAQLRKNKG
ncbi:MAG: YceD family protein [Bacteroidota bacterium]